MSIPTPKDLQEALKELLKVSDNTEAHPSYRYVIYARKSTDSEGKQERSIEDQLHECFQYAERNELDVAVKPIIEKASAKEPDIRPKFREMLVDISKGKYDGILCWHPDRLARNMKDAGEMMDLLDKEIIKDLKFVTFTFENNTMGKMLLGIAFVLSKQYSDKLSDDIKRGIRRSIEEGKSITNPKQGYYKDRNKFLRPDAGNFVIIQETFSKRLSGESIEQIRQFLIQSHYPLVTEHGKRKPQKITTKLVSEMLRDPFYAGVHVYGDSIVDLTEIYDFTPTISVKDFLRMNKLSNITKAVRLAEAIKSPGKIKADLMRGMIICGDCGHTRTAVITTKKKEGVTIEQRLNYRCDTIGCDRKGKSIRAKFVIDYIVEFLRTHPLNTEAGYKHYTQEMQNVLAKRQKEAESLLRSRQQSLTQTDKRIERIKTFLLDEIDADTKRTFKKDLKMYEEKRTQIADQIAKLKTAKENAKSSILSFQEFIELFQNLAERIEKIHNMADKDKLIRFIFSNFTVHGRKVTNSTQNSPFRELCGTENMEKFSDGGAEGN